MILIWSRFCLFPPKVSQNKTNIESKQTENPTNKTRRNEEICSTMNSKLSLFKGKINLQRRSLNNYISEQNRLLDEQEEILFSEYICNLFDFKK